MWPIKSPMERQNIVRTFMGIHLFIIIIIIHIWRYQFYAIIIFRINLIKIKHRRRKWVAMRNKYRWKIISEIKFTQSENKKIKIKKKTVTIERLLFLTSLNLYLLHTFFIWINSYLFDFACLFATQVPFRAYICVILSNKRRSQFRNYEHRFDFETD